MARVAFLILSDNQQVKSFHSSAPANTRAPLHLIVPPGVWVLNNLSCPLFGFQANYLQNYSNELVIRYSQIFAWERYPVGREFGTPAISSAGVEWAFFSQGKTRVLLLLCSKQIQGRPKRLQSVPRKFPIPVGPSKSDQQSYGTHRHRYLGWGILNLPKKITFAPLMEYRTGFPYSRLDSLQNYVGTPHSDETRFPDFFSLDVRLTREFRIFFKPKYVVRCLFRVN